METLQQYDRVVQSWMFYHRSVCQYRQMLYRLAFLAFFLEWKELKNEWPLLAIISNYKKKKERQVEF